MYIVNVNFVCGIDSVRVRVAVGVPRNIQRIGTQCECKYNECLYSLISSRQIKEQ